MPSYLWQAEESGSRKLLLSPLLPLEAAYRTGAWMHRRAYDVGLLRRTRLPVRVVSVGNLAVGGTGKTPLVAWLARGLRARGTKVAILCRGFRAARTACVNVVSDGDRILLSPADAGDEPIWLARATRGVPVLAGRNRVALGLRALAMFGAEVLLLDDGFQHHPIARDVDLVCLDARLGFGNGHVLPRGPLRESPRVVRRADAIVWTRVPANGRALPPDGDPSPLLRGLPQFGTEIRPRALVDLSGATVGAPDVLRGEEVGLLAAIARPDRLRADLERLGATVAKTALFSDHHPYRREDLQRLDKGLQWVTTAKDAVKIPPAWAQGRRLWVLEEELRPRPGSDLLGWLAARLAALRG